MNPEPERRWPDPQRDPAWMWEPTHRLTEPELAEYYRDAVAGRQAPQPDLSPAQIADIERQMDAEMDWEAREPEAGG